MVSLLITCPCCTWLMHTLPWQTCAALDDICIWSAPRFSTVGTSYFFLHPLVWSFPWLSFLGRILDSSQQNPLQLIYKERDLFKSSLGLPRWLSGKELTCQAGDMGSVPVLGRSPGEGNGNPLQYSCLEIPWMEKPGRFTVHGVTKESDMT